MKQKNLGALQVLTATITTRRPARRNADSLGPLDVGEEGFAGLSVGRRSFQRRTARLRPACCERWVGGGGGGGVGGRGGGELKPGGGGGAIRVLLSTDLSNRGGLSREKKCAASPRVVGPIEQK